MKSIQVICLGFFFWLEKIIIKPLILSFEQVFCNRTTLILYFLKVHFEGVNTYWHIL